MAESGLGDRISLSCTNVWTTDAGQQISYYSLPVNHPDANHFLQLSTAAFCRATRFASSPSRSRAAASPTRLCKAAIQSTAAVHSSSR